MFTVFILQACFASLVSQDYVNGTDQEEIRTGKNNIFYFVQFNSNYNMFMSMFQSLQVLTSAYRGSWTWLGRQSASSYRKGFSYLCRNQSRWSKR